MTADLQTILGVIAVIVVGFGGYALARFVQRQEESAPTRALQGIDALLTLYERMAINSREISEAEARVAANASRYLAIQKRIAGLTPVAVPASVTVAVKDAP